MKLNASRSLVLLAALGVALTVVVMARRADGPVTNPGRSNGGSATATAGIKETPVADLRLDRLKAEATELEASTRNPFQFKPKAVPKGSRTARSKKHTPE